MLEVIVPAILWFTTIVTVIMFVFGLVASSEYTIFAAVIVAIPAAVSWWAWVDTSWDPGLLLTSAFYAIGLLGVLFIVGALMARRTKKAAPKA